MAWRGFKIEVHNITLTLKLMSRRFSSFNYREREQPHRRTRALNGLLWVHLQLIQCKVKLSQSTISNIGKTRANCSSFKHSTNNSRREGEKKKNYICYDYEWMLPFAFFHHNSSSDASGFPWVPTHLSLTLQLFYPWFLFLLTVKYDMANINPTKRKIDKLFFYVNKKGIQSFQFGRFKHLRRLRVVENVI